MDNNKPDILETLEKERRWHTEQIKRIDLAITALNSKSLEKEPVKLPTEKVPWAAEISNLFKEFNTLTMKGIREKLAAKGYPQALQRSYNPTIFATVQRKVKQGEIVKVEHGRYKKKTKRRRLITTEPEEKREAPQNDASLFQ